VRLDRALAPGQTGCLRAGTYGDTGTTHRIDRDGSAAGRITLTSYPGETATVAGWVVIEASYTTVSHLRIDGSNTLYKYTAGTNSACRVDSGSSQALVIAGANNVLEYNDYFQSNPAIRGNGIGVGWWGRPDNTIIRFNKIHDVGRCEAYDHLVYLEGGNNVQIYDNWMWNDPHGRGVQLYTHPTNARIHANVIDRAGEGFSVGNEPGDTISGNEIYNNIVANSVGLPWQNITGKMIHDLYGGAPGTGNSFHDNLSFNNPGGIGHTTAVKTYNNTAADPKFIDAGNHDYRVATTSAAAGWRLWNGS
jgi:hypothetical protein